MQCYVKEFAKVKLLLDIYFFTIIKTTLQINMFVTEEQRNP